MWTDDLQVSSSPYHWLTVATLLHSIIQPWSRLSVFCEHPVKMTDTQKPAIFY